MAFIKTSAEQESSSSLKLAPKTPHHSGGDIVFRSTPSSSVKMSELILEFVGDLLRHSDTQDERERAIDFACLAWNLAILKEQQVEQYQTVLDSVLSALQLEDQSDKMTTALLIEALVEKKLTMYASIHRWIKYYRSDLVGKEFRVHITSGVPEAPPRIDDLMRAILGD